MSKRIVLIDYNETPNFSLLYGRGIEADRIFSLELVNSMSDKEREELLKFGPGDAVMLIGGEPFRYLQQWYHFGVRSENYFDCSKLYRLSMTGGGFAKCCAKLPTLEEIEQFLNVDFTIPVDLKVIQKVLKTYEEAVKFLDWLENRPEDEDFGFDYEASGFPLDKWFEISGASICNCQYAGFLAFTDLRHNCSKDQYEEILHRLGKWLEKRMSHIWVYNMQYEFQVSHRMLGVDLYNLCDASVVNVLDGHHLKKFSLKWTAQRILGVNVWDSEFDKLSDLFENMYFDIVGKTKKDKTKIFKVTPTTYQDSPEFKEIIKMYPQYEEEFKSLIQEYWGLPFMNIPSDILGYYCNLDSFYTLHSYLRKKNEYSKECWEVFLDNTRLGCRLHSQGLYIDEAFRLRYKEESEKMMAWGITYTATARCALKIKAFESKSANLEKYPPHCKTLLVKNMFCKGNVMDILKNVLSSYIDTLDATELGLDEGRLAMEMGDDFADGLRDILKSSMEEVKFKGKIDAGVVRKKKLLECMKPKVESWLEIGKVKVDSDKHKNLETLLYYQRAYKELSKISHSQLPDIYNIPETIRAFGQTFGLKDYSSYISDNYFKCKSPIENDAIIDEMWEIYKPQTSYLAALMESTHQMPGENGYYKDLNITDPNDGFKHFMEEWEKWCYDQSYEGKYPKKMYTESLKFYQQGKGAGDPVKEVWTDFKGFNVQADYFKGIDSEEQIDKYETPFELEDIDDDFFFIRKFTLNYLLYKKYSKVLSTYIDGMFKMNNKWVIEGPDHIPLREADPSEPGAIEKSFVHYEVNTKSSKRWSSGYHTLLSHFPGYQAVTLA